MSAISPKYLMHLVDQIESTLWDSFETNKYKNVRFYIEKWHECVQVSAFDFEENFHIFIDSNDNIDLKKTLHNISGELLLKIAIDLGIDTPDFIPCIPKFRNELKSSYRTASATFESAFKKIESEPDIAIGLANSALESIIKEILKDERVKSKIKGKETLYDLTSEILRVLSLFPHSNMHSELKPIGSGLLSASKAIETLRSEKTDFHGKTEGDVKIEDPLYTYFVVNAITTIGLFLKSLYNKNFPKEMTNVDEEFKLPF